MVSVNYPDKIRLDVLHDLSELFLSRADIRNDLGHFDSIGSRCRSRIEQDIALYSERLCRLNDLSVHCCKLIMIEGCRTVGKSLQVD